MERKLAEFRAARREPFARSAKPSGKTEAPSAATREQAQAQSPQPPVEEESIQRAETFTAHAVTTPLPWWIQCLIKNVTFLKFLLWLVLLGLFVELEFGLPYFVLSMFYWLYIGTRGPGERQAGEKSAYSVFNPGCEAIQGTLTAEQFERELHYRPLNQS
uniref:SAYSVFN motif domain containing 1 n=1 Tax=Salvator merianae TaxID=96440 RepID=A0A8D0BMZ7_SALMN